MTSKIGFIMERGQGEDGNTTQYDGNMNHYMCVKFMSVLELG